MFGVSSLILLAVATLSRSAPTSGGAPWGYTGSNGVDHWASLFPQYCNGSSQSPIDLVGATYDPALEVDVFQHTGFDTVDAGADWTLTNNGHSAVVTFNGGNYSTQGGGLSGVYNALQFHFHWGSTSSQGSEHHVAGRAYPMEMHIVHMSELFTDFATGLSDPEGLAVLGVMFRVSNQDNPKLAPVISALAKVIQEGSSTTFPPMALADFLPANTQRFYRYRGGLTTPACNEAVVWTVFSDPLKISENQLAAFRNLLHGTEPIVDNFRPVQPSNGRQIRASFQWAGEATENGELEPSPEGGNGIESNGGELEPGTEVENVTESNGEMEVPAEGLGNGELEPVPEVENVTESNGEMEFPAEALEIGEVLEQSVPEFENATEGNGEMEFPAEGQGNGEVEPAPEFGNATESNGEMEFPAEGLENGELVSAPEGENATEINGEMELPADHTSPGDHAANGEHNHDGHGEAGHGQDGHSHGNESHGDAGHGQEGHSHGSDGNGDAVHGSDGHNNENGGNGDAGHGPDGHNNENGGNGDAGHGPDGHNNVNNGHDADDDDDDDDD